MFLLLFVLPTLMVIGLSLLVLLASMPWWVIGLVFVGCGAIGIIEQRLLAYRPPNLSLIIHRIVACIYGLSILVCFLLGFKNPWCFLLASPVLISAYNALIGGSRRVQILNPLPSRFYWHIHLPLLYVLCEIGVAFVVPASWGVDLIGTIAVVMLGQLVIIGLADRIESSSGRNQFRAEQAIITVVLIVAIGLATLIRWPNDYLILVFGLLIWAGWQAIGIDFRHS